MEKKSRDKYIISKDMQKQPLKNIKKTKLHLLLSYLFTTLDMDASQMAKHGSVMVMMKEMSTLSSTFRISRIRRT